MTRRSYRLAWGALLALAASSCAVVPSYRREIFTDPAMDTSGADLEARALRKLHTAREGASGGDGAPAGGGCGCSN